MRLKDLCSAVPADVTKGIILGNTAKTNKIFHDISELTAQFQLDIVIAFDITIHENERTLVVNLKNWGR